MVELAPMDWEFAAMGFSQHIWTDVGPNPPPSKHRSGKTPLESPSGIGTPDIPLGFGARGRAASLRESQGVDGSQEKAPQELSLSRDQP